MAEWIQGLVPEAEGLFWRSHIKSGWITGNGSMAIIMIIPYPIWDLLRDHSAYVYLGSYSMELNERLGQEVRAFLGLRSEV